ncbi:TadE/TadG family type IV pilus assembly protein [Aeromicrobium sp.]|uniref:TadE/TadG family type IV pilus assembly protein n=1 Tax=Aeromicrobium sp. TaxID=1871063 RepID=UPI002FC654BD
MRRIDSRQGPSRDERGATALMIAILLPTVLLGLGAIVVNVGGWYVARGMDQNSADAAVIAVAETCADGTCDPSAANQYADSLSNGQLAGETMFVCGTAPGLAACASEVENGQMCPLPHSAPYVDVLVTPEGGSMENFTSGTQVVGACAQAILDAPASCDDCAAVTISQCEWELNTAGGTEFAPQQTDNSYSNGEPPSFIDTIEARRADPQYRVDPADPDSNIYVEADIEDPQTPKGSASIGGSETVLFTHGADTAGGCGGSGNGANAPGQFGWLAGTNDPCKVTINGSTYPGDSGNNPVKSCKGLFEESRTNATPIYLPVYSSASGSGSNMTYTLEGFAAFVVTGWNVGNFGSDKKRDSRVGMADSTAGFPHSKQTYCGKPNQGFTTANSDICISGYFTEALVTGGQLSGGGGTNLGLTSASLAG